MILRKKYLLLFLVVFIFLNQVDCVNKCEMKLPSGEKFDFGKIPEIGVSLEYCGETNHKLNFRLCDNIPSDMCDSTKSTGPANACDVYGEDEGFYWVGGLDRLTTGAYDKKKYKFLITYYGTKQAAPFEWTRNLEVTMECGEEEYISVCDSIYSPPGGTTTTYKTTVRTKYACIEQISPALYIVEIIIAFVLLSISLFCCIALIICCVCSCFLVFVMFACSTSVFGGSVAYQLRKRPRFKKKYPINTTEYEEIM